MAKQNEITVVETTISPVRVEQNQLENLMSAAGLPANLSNRDAINMVSDAILAEVAQKPKNELTRADVFAVRAAIGAKAAPTAGEEVQRAMQNNPPF